MGLLLLFLLGGAAAVYVASSLSTPKGAGASDFMNAIEARNALDDAFAVVIADEHFEDPIFLCFGSQINPDIVSRGAARTVAKGGYGSVSETVVATPFATWSGMNGDDPQWLWLAHPGYDMPDLSNVPPYTVVPNTFAMGGTWWINSGMGGGGKTWWPMYWNFPFNAVDMYGDPDDISWGNGYEYLASVENSAKARIAAVRAKVAARAAARGKPNFTTSQSSMFDFLAVASWKNLGNLASSVKGVLADESKYEELAAAAGVDVPQIKALAGEVLKKAASGAPQSEIVSDAAVYVVPVANTIASAITSAVRGDPSGVVTIEALKTVAGYVPVYGQIIQIGLAMLEGKIMSDAAASAEACRNIQQRIANLQKTAAEAKLPIPWHVTEIFGSSWCNEGGSTDMTPYQAAVIGILETNIQFMSNSGEGESLSVDDIEAVKKWWAATALFASDTRVYDVFDALGWDIYGGTLASDEQVMLVAAPVALAGGIADVDEFAKRLWSRSKGWRDTNSGSQVVKQFNPPVCAESERGASVRNAWWLQWAALSRDAFALADELKGRAEPKDIFGNPATMVHYQVSPAMGRSSVLRPDVAAIERPGVALGSLPPAVRK
jgi:hypothetical protein